MMYMDKEELRIKIYNDLKGDYSGVKRVVMENENVFRVYADDDTLWKIFDDMLSEFKSIEFDAEAGEKHFLRVII